MSVAFYHRKANLGRLLPAVRFEVTFTDDRTEIRRANVGDVAELAVGLPRWERILQVVRRGPLTLALIAEELDAKPDIASFYFDSSVPNAYRRSDAKSCSAVVVTTA